MEHSWSDTRQSFCEAAGWFVSTAATVGDRWTLPGLGDWDVRGLVGHTCRALLTVESYLATPAAKVDVESPAGYFDPSKAAAASAAISARGREAGAALGDDPAAAVAQIAERVVALVGECDGAELVTTIAGGMRLRDYLPTRTFELAVHTADLAVALDQPPDVPRTAASTALGLVVELALADGTAGLLLLAATGRAGLPAGFSVI